MPIPPWQVNQQRSSFPIPPRNIGGILAPPVNQRDLQNAQGIALLRPKILDSPHRSQVIQGNKGILDEFAGRTVVMGNSPRPLLGQQQTLLPTQRAFSSQQQGIISNSPRPLLGLHGGNGKSGILDKRIEEFGATSRPGILSREWGERPQKNGPRESQFFLSKAAHHPVKQNQTMHKQNYSPKQPGLPANQNKGYPGSRNKSKTELVNRELEEKASKAEMSKEFYDRVKPLSNVQVANFVALEFSLKEIAIRKNKVYTGKSSGIGHYMCNICKVNHLSHQKLQAHYKSSDHKELEELFTLKKEQVRLIMNNKIKEPATAANENPNQNSDEMLPIARAEVEMNLKPTEIDLDAYILGVYESIMKPYWVVPKSSYYCRICNYTEFKSERELTDHKKSREHQRREVNYDNAFCLYCQVHTGDEKKMADHEKNDQHIKVKGLMERTKQCAIEHWHKVNKKDLPSKYANISSRTDEITDEATKNDPKIGSKRSAPADDRTSASPTKKVTTTREAQKSQESRDLNPKKSSILNRRNGNNLDGESHSLGSGNTDFDRHRDEISDSDKIWFAPIFGFMCKACHKFLANAKEQKEHTKDQGHSAAVAKFKKSIVG